MMVIPVVNNSLSRKIASSKLAFKRAKPTKNLEEHDSYIRGLYSNEDTPNYDNLGFVSKSLDENHKVHSKKILENGNIFQIANNSAYLQFNPPHSIALLEKKPIDNDEVKLTDIEKYVKKNCKYLLPVLSDMEIAMADIDHVFIHDVFPFVPYYLATSKKGGSDWRWAYLVALAWKKFYGFMYRGIPFDILVCNPNKGFGTTKQKHFKCRKDVIERKHCVGKFTERKNLSRVYWLPENFKEKNFDYDSYGVFSITSSNLECRIAECYVEFESKLGNLVKGCRSDSEELSLISLHRELDKWYCQSCSPDTDENEALSFYDESDYDEIRGASPITFGTVDNVLKEFS
jgi:hypothetical protein